MDFYSAPPSTYSLLSNDIPSAEEITQTKSSSETSILKQQAPNGISLMSEDEEAVIPLLSDTIGNLTSLGDMSFVWENGRQLKSSSFVFNNANITMEYGYNADGQRTSKAMSINGEYSGITYEYIYNGSILAGVKWLNYSLVYMYDNNGDIFGFNLDGKNYYYIKNAQNDVIAMTNEAGTIICRYHY